MSGSHLEGLSYNPGNVKLWESSGIAEGLPWINYIGNLALAYTKVGRLDESIRLSLRALDIAPDARWLHYNIAITYFNAGRFTEACKHFDRSMELDPGHEGTKIWLKYMQDNHYCK